MLTDIDRAVVITAAILPLALRIRFAFALRRMIEKLRSRYPLLSEDLGNPLPDFAVGICVSVFCLVLLSLRYQRFTEWLIRGTYRKLKDEEITRLWGRLGSYGILYAGGYGLLLGYAALRLVA